MNTLSPSHRAADGAAVYGGPGGHAYFAHELVNASSRAQVFDLSASSDLGWTLQLMDDPDGDGRAWDSEWLPGATSLPIWYTMGRDQSLVVAAC